MLALAKLEFKANEKSKAMQLCLQMLQHLNTTTTANTDDTESSCSNCACALLLDDEDDDASAAAAADAYHLAGWVHIHADDHTSAYRIWNEGGRLLPNCSVLRTQTRKRICWDNDTIEDEVDHISESNDRRAFDIHDLVSASVPSSLTFKVPALALFDPVTQKNQLVFSTTTPILSAVECTRVLQAVQDFHKDHRHGIWSTVRHSSVKTTDVAVEDIPALRPWLRTILLQRLYPMLRVAFPKLADGSTLDNNGTTRMRVHDAFIVRYDAEHDMSLSLPEHSDTSVISFTVALNQRGTDFEGGGTWFESMNATTTATTNDDDNTTNNPHMGLVVDADQGHAVAFAGPLRHAGYPVTSGCRIILVLFLYAQDFAYGHLLDDFVERHKQQQQQHDDGNGPCCDTDTKNTSINGGSDNKVTRPSGDSPGGFVVYNQTVELVSMLNRQVASILDE